MIDPRTVKYGSNLFDNLLVRERVTAGLDMYQQLADFELSEREFWIVDKYIQLTRQCTGYIDINFVQRFKHRMLGDISLNTELKPEIKLPLMTLIDLFCEDQISHIRWVNGGTYE